MRRVGGAPQSGRRLLKSGRGPRTAARVLGAEDARRLLLKALGIFSSVQSLSRVRLSATP